MPSIPMQTSPSLLTVTLNPALDRNYCVAGFRTDGVHRARSLRVTAGGKGVNVARVWRTLGGRAVATGLAGGTAGAFLRAAIVDEGIEDKFVEIEDETRTSIEVFDPTTGAESVVNEDGPAASTAEIAKFMQVYGGLVGTVDYVAISGSAALGIEPSIYTALVSLATSQGVRVLVDVSAANLVAAATGSPTYIKPNREEASALGAHIDRWDHAGREAMTLCQSSGAEAVMISGGAAGAVVATSSQAWSAQAPAVPVVTTLGSGDSMSAGFLWGLALKPDDYGHALHWGIAAGTANTLRQGAGWLSMAEIEEIWGKIIVNLVT